MKKMLVLVFALLFSMFFVAGSMMAQDAQTADEALQLPEESDMVMEEEYAMPEEMGMEDPWADELNWPEEEVTDQMQEEAEAAPQM